MNSKFYTSVASLKVDAAKAEADENEKIKTIKLTVNGALYKVEVKPHWTLWDVLREKLGFTSVKEMCLGSGACGSCTVLMDGRPILSCMTLAISCDGAVVETAEGIAKAGHPVVDAWVTHYGFQCGYCTPGVVVTAKALLDRNPNPSDEEIIEAMSGNLCRCHTYPRWLPAVREAAAKLKR